MIKLCSYTLPKEDPKIRKYIYRLQFHTKFLIHLAFFESSKIFLINMVTLLMMSTKMATLGILK